MVVTFRSSTAALISLGALSAVPLGGSAAFAAQRPVCGPSRSDLRTVRQTPSIRVFERRDDRRGEEGGLYLCRRGQRATWSLATARTYSTEQTAGRLIGAFLLVSESSGGGVGDGGGVVHVVDTRTGRYADTGGWYQAMTYDALQVTREGIAVWLALVPDEAGTHATVRAIGPDGRALTLDDRGGASDLRLIGRTVTWRQAGVPQQPFVFAGPPRYRSRLTRVVFARR